MKLSLSMIVKNEAKNLPRCLESIKGLVDEIVIVDTGSTDDTVKIAESYGAKVGYFEWCNDFSAARNASLDLCTGDWVLILDADEAIDKMDHDAIRNAMYDNDYPAYNFILRNYFNSASCATFDKAAVRNQSGYEEGREYPYCADSQVMRMFRRSPEIRWEGRVHELFCRHLTERGIHTGHTNSVIHHYGKMDAEREGNKKALYYELAEEDLKSRPGDPQYLFNLAVQAYAAEKLDRCLYACESYMKKERRVKVIILLIAGVCYQTANRHDAALKCFELILQNKPNHVAALVQSAISKAQLGDVRATKKLLEVAMGAGPEYVNTYLVLAKVYESEGDRVNALLTLQRGLNVNSDDATLLREADRFGYNPAMTRGA